MTRPILRWLTAGALAVAAGSAMPVVARAAAKRPRQPGKAAPAPTAPAPAARTLSAPHEGVTARLDDTRHLELLVDKKGLSLWLVDAKGALLPVGRVAGSARVVVEDKPDRHVELAATGDHLRADLDLETALRLDVVVTITEADRAAPPVSLHWGLLDRKDIDDTPL